jgi:hypothetical protein
MERRIEEVVGNPPKTLNLAKIIEKRLELILQKSTHTVTI